MQRIIGLSFIFWCLSSFALPAQTVFSTGYSGTGSNIDVNHHTCFWRINPDSTIKYIRGYVQTNFTAIQNNVSKISFDMNKVLLIDSILYHQQILPSTAYTHLGNIINITLTQPLSTGTKDSILIYYNGHPPSPSGAAAGFTLSTDQSTNNKYISTLSESYEDRDWWPCKADMQDKIDSIDIIVSVPWTGTDTFWVASNGVLLDSAISGNSRIFHYKETYPIASYLVSVAVARYNRYYRAPITIGGTKVPVVYYLFAGKQATEYTSIISNMDQATKLLSLYSNKYGDYPFKKQKHGFYEGLATASGMEHQTFSAIATYSLNDVSTLAHELMHQWFGDKVSFATWNDLWLAEGFAVYGEILASELLSTNTQDVINTRTSVKQNAQNITNVGVWIPDSSILNSNLIWNSSYGSAVYDRGGMIVSMLRTMCGDSLYFKIMKQYIGSPTLAYKTASTDTLIHYFNTALGVDITPFFTDYVYGNGYPTYNIQYEVGTNNSLVLSVINQSTTSGAASFYFRGPVAVRFQGATASQDTLLVFFDWGNGDLSYAGNGISAQISGNRLWYNLPFTPVTVSFDPYAMTLANGGTILDLKIIDFAIQQQKHAAFLTLQLDANKNKVPVHLQRSNNGKDYTDMGTMNLQSSPDIFTYTFTDSVPANNINYYRAYYTTESGAIQYSKVLTANFSKEIKLSIYPNPVKNQISINYDNTFVHKTVQYAIYDATGKCVYQTVKQVNELVDMINLPKLPKGTYTLQIQPNGALEPISKVFIKE